MTLETKIAMPVPVYPWNLYLINNVGDLVNFLVLNLIIFFCSRNVHCARHFCRETAIENNQFSNQTLFCITMWTYGSGIVVFAGRVTWSYTYSPFNIHILFSKLEPSSVTTESSLLLYCTGLGAVQYLLLV